MDSGTNLNYIIITPFTRIKEGWQITNKLLNNLVNNFDHSTKFINFNDTYSITLADPELHQRAFLHVVTETIFNYPHNANGEKTFKPISVFRPFVMVCVPGALQDLRDLGFKTFSDWWDESYDCIQDPTERIYAIVDIVKWVCKQDLDDLKKMLYQMQPVLEHNYDYYYNNFLTDQLTKFDQACYENLKPR